MSNIIVQKFGGTSVASPKRIEAVAKIVGQEIDSGNHVAVVVSAMAGETNRLIDLAKKIQKKPNFQNKKNHILKINIKSKK